MRRGSIGLRLAAALLAARAASVHASFQDTRSSIKAEALGGAFVGMADDPTTVFLNPAGLVNLQAPEASLMYGSPMAGLEGVDLKQGYAALGIPLGRRAALGLGATMLQASGLLSERQAAAGLGVRLGSRVAAGVSATYLHHDYEIGDDPAYAGQPVFAGGTSKGAFGLDLGLLAFVTRDLRFGASARHINKPDVGLRDYDPVPRELRFGLFWRTPYAGLAADLEQRDDHLGTGQSTETVWRVGVEVPVRALRLRAGANSRGLSAGLGLRAGAFGLDYAFSMLDEVQASNLGAQFLSLSFRFAGPGRREEPEDRGVHDAFSNYGGTILFGGP